jgi:hypothetical protein
MKHLSGIWVLLAMVGCSASPSKHATSESAISCYASQDATGYNQLRLRLNSDGSYTADIQGDIGSWGSASGQWRVSDNTITFVPVAETEHMQGFLRAAQKRSNGSLSIPQESSAFSSGW